MFPLLSIDGGGIRGLVAASFLEEIEERTGKSVVDYFDLIAGTSAGGIIALGLGLGLPPREIARLFRERGTEIFGTANWKGRWSRAIRGIFYPKYDTSPLRTELAAVFGSRRLGESRTRLVIPAYDPRRRDVHIFKTAHHPRFGSDYRESAVTVALATAAAPTFFPAHVLRTGAKLIDGGVWANNPTGVAVVEAVGVLQWPSHSLRILSLGCTEDTWSFRSDTGLLGLGTLGRSAVRLFIQGQTASSLGTAKILSCHSDTNPTIWRISPAVPTNVFSMDDTRQIPELSSLGSSEARSAATTLDAVFLSEPAAEFVPAHRLA